MTDSTEDKGRTLAQIEHALAYLQCGWSLVMMPTGTKGPTHQGWNNPSELVNTPEKALARLSAGPQNMGLVHMPSNTVSIDVDDEAWSRVILEQFGIDYDDLMQRGMRIFSKQGRDKVIFAGAPADLPLLKIQWPTPEATKPTDRMTIIEFRAGPNQDVLPPSQHPDGHLYQWWPGTEPWSFEGKLPQIPDMLLQFWRALADSSTGLRDEVVNLCPWKKQHQGRKFTQRARQLNSEHNDVIGQFNQANHVEDLLDRAGYKRKGRRWLAPSSSTAIPGVVVLEDKCYSHHGSDPLADGYAHDAFDLLVVLEHGGNLVAALADAANQLGIERTKREPAPDMVIDLAAVLAAQEARRVSPVAHKAPISVIGDTPVSHNEPNVAQVSHEQPKFSLPPARQVEKPAEPDGVEYPAHLLSPPGMVGEVVKWILQTAQRPQPILSVAAALAMFGCVLGQKVSTSTGLRTNIYLVGVGGTSAGKDHPRKAVKLAMLNAGIDGFLGGEEFGSGQGLLARVAKAANTLFLPDEFGLLLKAVSAKQAANHERSIMTNLMKLFSSAGTVYNGSEYADQKNRARVDILYPCVSLYGTTTPETFYPALGSGDVTSGYLNRLLVVSAPEKRVAWQESSLTAPPEAIVAWVKAARAMQCGGLMGIDPASPIEVPMAGMSKNLFTQFREWIEHQEDELKRDQNKAALVPLWGRAWEHAAKVALVMACTRIAGAEQLKTAAESGGLEIDMSSAQWAIDFVRFVLLDMERQVATRVGDSDFDRQCQDALRVIRAGGIQGRTAAELGRYSRAFRALEPRVQDTVLEALKRREDVFTVQYPPTSGRGKARMAWVSTAHQADVEAAQAEPSNGSQV